MKLNFKINIHSFAMNFKHLSFSLDVIHKEFKEEILYNDFHNENIKTILNLLNENEKNFIAIPLYDVNDEDIFMSSYVTSQIELIVKLKNNIPEEVLGINEENSHTIVSLLNQENANKEINYKLFKFHGELKK